MAHANSSDSLSRFLEIIAKLRDPNGGCPWDLKQTFESLKPLVIEEAYEVSDGVEKGPEAIKEELGDLMSLIALFAQIASERSLFSFAQILDGISDKLVRRHPHVFGDTKVSGTEEVLKNWEEIKKNEKKSEGAPTKGLLDGLPRSLPALLKAHEIGERCARVGFDWSGKQGVADKVREELGEFLHETTIEGITGDTKEPMNPKVFEEFGDLLFTLAQYSRHLGFNSEEALRAANEKFLGRFRALERLANERYQGTPLSELGSTTLEALWQEVKLALRP